MDNKQLAQVLVESPQMKEALVELLGGILESYEVDSGKILVAAVKRFMDTKHSTKAWLEAEGGGLETNQDHDHSKYVEGCAACELNKELIQKISDPDTNQEEYQKAIRAYLAGNKALEETAETED